MPKKKMKKKSGGGGGRADPDDADTTDMAAEGAAQRAMDDLLASELGGGADGGDDAATKKKSKKKKKNTKKGGADAAAAAAAAEAKASMVSSDDDDADNSSSSDDDPIERMARHQTAVASSGGAAASAAAMVAAAGNVYESEVDATTRRMADKARLQKRLTKSETERRRKLAVTLSGVDADDDDDAREEFVAKAAAEREAKAAAEAEAEDEAKAAPALATSAPTPAPQSGVESYFRTLFSRAQDCLKAKDHVGAAEHAERCLALMGQGQYVIARRGQEAALVQIEAEMAAFRATEEAKQADAKQQAGAKAGAKGAAAVAPGMPAPQAARFSASAFSVLAAAALCTGETRRAIQYWLVANGLLREATPGRSRATLQLKVLKNLQAAFRDVGDAVRAAAAAGAHDKLAKQCTPHATLDRVLEAACGRAGAVDALAVYCAGDGAFTEAEAALGGGVDHREPMLGATALMAAARCGHAALIASLLERDADARLKDSCGQTAAVWAAMHGHAAAVRQLMDCAAARHGDGAAAFPMPSTLPPPIVKVLSSAKKSGAEVAAIFAKLQAIEQQERQQQQAQQALQAQQARAPPAPPPAQQQQQQTKKKGGKKGGKATGAALEKGFHAAPKSAAAARGDLVGRKLQAWQPDAGEDLDLDGGSLQQSAKQQQAPKKWDQFATNAQKFGVTSTYDENIYTTKLDNSNLTTAQVAEAERLADEILEGKTKNPHMLEEREQGGGPVATGGDDDEEARYGAVLGTGGYADGKGGAQESDGFTDAGVTQKKGKK